MKKELVQKQEAGALVSITEEELAQSYGDFGADHISIPRMVILEGLSDEIRERKGSPGDLFIKTLNRNLGESTEIVVITRMHQQLRWTPKAQGKGILCQAQDGKHGVGDPGGDCAVCPQRQWSGKNPPTCDQLESFIVVLREDLKNGEAFPLAISGGKTKLKGLKAFNTLLMQLAQRRLPLFAKAFKVSVVEKQNDKGTFHVFAFETANDNKQLPVDEQQQAYQLLKSFGSRKIVIDPEQEPTSPAAEDLEI